jgi:hypothetical protein
MNLFDEKFIKTEQPTICPFCGNRTEIILDLSHTSQETQIHQCLSSTKHIFVEVSD